MATLLTACNNTFEAELLKGRLESEGIPCVLQGETMNLVYGGISAMPINILVREEDLEKALELIKNDNTED
ncbi:MAG: DUF2007 domain-containing protein [Bacteroidaceae bacterium]|nr:DUF2007 domain-containing protein [Bacteroidaceae bacterium]